MSNEQRGEAIKQRRLARGIKSLREFAKATEVDRQAIGKAEAGEGTTGVYERLEAWLDRFDEETGADESGLDLVTIELSDGSGTHLIVSGPVKDREALEESALRLLAKMHGDATPSH